MDKIFKLISEYQEAFLKGLGVTFNLYIIIVIFGLFFGLLFGALSYKYKFNFGLVIRSISFFLTGIPILVFLYWFHYPFQKLLSIVVDPFLTAAFVFSFINTFIISDILYNAIKHLPQQYVDAAIVCGIPKRERILRIEMPLIFKHFFPSYLLAQVNILHATLFASLITVDEIFKTCQVIIAKEQDSPVEIYTALGIFFLAISLPINGIAYFLRKKYSLSESLK